MTRVWCLAFLLPVIALWTGCRGTSEEQTGARSSQSLEAQMAAYLKSPEYRRAVEDRLALMKKEEQFLESAAWLGKTGLGEDVERELPRYLRRELGESVLDPGSLKADDL